MPGDVLFNLAAAREQMGFHRSGTTLHTDTITIGEELPQRQVAVLGGFDAERGDQK